jgi:predicted HTH transcriptional regulator
VEKAGTGTTDMIADCRNAGLPEPDFEQRGPYFVATVWRDWLTDEVFADYDLNDRQKKAVISPNFFTSLCVCQGILLHLFLHDSKHNAARLSTEGLVPQARIRVLA